MDFQPVMQKPNGCLSACWASILGLSVDDVPVWSHLDNDEYNTRMPEFLRPLGFGYAVYKVEGDETVEDLAKFLEKFCGYAILVLCASDTEPMQYHSVVIKGRTMVHNPASKQGIMDITQIKHPIQEVILPVCLEPWRHVRKVRAV